MPASVAAGVTQNTSNPLVINRPSGVEAGDLLIAFVASDGTGVTLGAPGGWVLIGGKNDNQRSMRAWYRLATNNEPATYAFTSSSGNTVRASMVVVVGAPTNNPIDVVGTWQAGTGNTLSVSGMSPAAASGELQIAFLTTNAAANYTMPTPSGWTALAQDGTDNKAHMAWRTVSNSAPAASFTGTNLYGWGTGTILVASGQVVTIERSIVPAKSLLRGPFARLFTGSITPAGVANTMRVVVRVFSRSIGGAGTTDDNFTDAFGDSFIVSGGTPSALSSTLTKTPTKTLSRSINTYGGYAKVTAKLLESSITITGTSRRVIIRVFRATITPVATMLTQNAGRLFGAPGIVDITVRLAGEIRARVRRR